MKYCSRCAQEVVRKIPEGEDRERDVCPSCEEIFYVNPKIIVGCIPTVGDQVLLCKRAIEPRYGKWTLPAGFMENGESAEEGALRETLEEAKAEPIIERFFSLYSIPHIDQVYLTFLARLDTDEFSEGPESLEVRWFDHSEIPWDDIAFSAVKHALRRWVDAERGETKTHLGSFRKDRVQF